MNWSVFIVADLDLALVARLGTVADDHLFGASTLALVAIEILIDTHLTGKHAVDAAACFLCKTQTAMASVWNADALAVGADGFHRLKRLEQQIRRAQGVLARALPDLLQTRSEVGVPYPARSLWPRSQPVRPFGSLSRMNSG